MLIRTRYNKGFTLIEIIVVISILALLAAVAVPAYTGYIRKAKEKVCNVNCLQIERMYETYLGTEGIEHSDIVFEEFLQEQGKIVCPEHGVITYVDGNVCCSKHSKEDKHKDEEGGGDVPFLD